MKRAQKFMWFTVGAGGGAGLVYLFGTRHGKRIRRRLIRTAEDGRFRMMEGGKDLLDRGKEMADDAREFLARGTRAFSFPR